IGSRKADCVLVVADIIVIPFLYAEFRRLYVGAVIIQQILGGVSGTTQVAFFVQQLGSPCDAVLHNSSYLFNIAKAFLLHLYKDLNTSKFLSYTGFNSAHGANVLTAGINFFRSSNESIIP